MRIAGELSEAVTMPDAARGGKEVAHGSVAQVGNGEVFVLARQSNSTNHGQEKQTTKTQRVASFAGKAWRIANDPQPGSSVGGGSFVPSFGDASLRKRNVPVGNPMQRGFSTIFSLYTPECVGGFVSMRPGITFQVHQPGAAQVLGFVVFGEDDGFFARPSREKNLAVEPKTDHSHGEKTWPLVFSFLRHTFTARVPANADERQGPVKLNTLTPETGHLGQNWDSTKGGYQTLSTAPFATFTSDKATASWPMNAAYAADWQAFQRDGKINKTH